MEQHERERAMRRASGVTLITLGTLALAIGTILVTFATPADGQELACTTVEIEHADWGTTHGAVSHDEGAPTYAIVGPFVWFTWGDDPDNYGQHDTLSFDVSDPAVVSATGCSDGSVTIDRVEPEFDPEPVPLPSVEGDTTQPEAEIGESLTVTDLTPVCEQFPSTLEFYCQLLNRALAVIG